MGECVCPLCGGHYIGCPACKGFGIILQRSKVEENKRRNQKSLKDASHNGKDWSKRDLEILADTEHYSIKQAAYVLKRSIKSVETMRYRLRKGFVKIEK